MITIAEYIRSQYLEVPEHLWSDVGVLLFAQFLAQDHSYEYDAMIEEINFRSLHNSIIYDEPIDIAKECITAKLLIIHAFKEEIRHRVGELQGEIEDAEEMRQEFEATEARGINNESYIG